MCMCVGVCSLFIVHCIVIVVVLLLSQIRSQPCCGVGRVTIDEDGLTVLHYAGNGTLIYTAPTIKERKQKINAWPLK